VNGKLTEALEFKPGGYVKWEHLKWVQVLDAFLGTDGWMHLRLEGFNRECTIQPSIELPWHP
jgi:hypothetical protein